MKRIVLTLVILLCLPARDASAGVALSWGACPGLPGATSVVSFDCRPESDASYRLFGTFGVPSSFGPLDALEARLDLEFPCEPEVPDFWNFYEVICGTSSRLETLDNQAGCGDAAYPYPIGPLTVWPVMLGYQTGTGGADRAQLLVVHIGTGGEGLMLDPARRYYGFELRFRIPTVECTGCATWVPMVWARATVYDASGGELAIDTAEPGSQPRVTVNGVNSPCGPTPAVPRTWGRIKAQYR